MVLPMACLRYYGGSDFCRVPLSILSRQISCVHAIILA